MGGKGRKGYIEIGVALLLFELINSFNTIPPVIFFLIVMQKALMYVGLIPIPWDPWESCLSSYSGVYFHQYWRFILSAFEHGHSLHLYFNMSAFLNIARVMERKYQSRNFFILIMILVLLTGIMYVCLTEITAFALDDKRYLTTCVIGFSGVLFALKVILAWENPGSRTIVSGVFMPISYSYWLELLLIYFFTAESSLIGHFSGIVAGLIYCLFHSSFDFFITSLTGCHIEHGPWDNEQTTGIVETFMNRLTAYEWHHRYFTAPAYFHMDAGN